LPQLRRTAGGYVRRETEQLIQEDALTAGEAAESVRRSCAVVFARLTRKLQQEIHPD
jgi:hypothetical protein